MIQSGSFAARAVGLLQFVKSPEKGTPGVEVSIELKAGPNTGERIQWIGWLTDATSTRTADSLALMGYDGESPESITRREFVAVIEHEQYVNKAGEQKTRARVAWINDPSGGGRMEPMSNAEMAGAKDRLRAALAASKQKTGNSRTADEPKF